MIPIHVSAIFAPLKIEAYLDVNEEEPVILDSYLSLINEKIKNKLSYVLALVQDVGSLNTFYFDAESLAECIRNSRINPLTRAKICHIFHFTLVNFPGNKSCFNYLGEIEEDNVLNLYNGSKYLNKTFIRAEGDCNLLPLSPLKYSIFDVSDFVYKMPFTNKKSNFSQLIAEQKKANLPYIFTVVQDESSSSFHYFQGANFTENINPLTKKKIVRVIYCAISLLSNVKNICFQILGTSQEVGTKKHFIETFFSATEGVVEAQYRIGTYYTQGKGVEQNFEEGFKWFKLAADAGNRDAEFELSAFYMHGKGIKKDSKKAIELLTNAARIGHLNATFQLGVCYLDGIGVEIDRIAAAAFFMLAEVRGHPLAKEKFELWQSETTDKEEGQFYCLLGCYFMKGMYVDKDNLEAVKLWSTAVIKGNVDAIYLLARYYLSEGRYLDKAIELLTAASNMGLESAQYYLGVCYYKGEGVIENRQKSLELLKYSANQGFIKSRVFLGNYYDAEGDFDESVKWWMLAAGQGHIGAQFSVGCYHYLKKDYKEAVKWFDLAAKKEYTQAICQLGVCLFNGIGIKKNEKKAATYFKQASENGFPEAQYQYSHCLLAGSGVKKDEVESMKWLILAAGKDHRAAQFEVGNCYLEGRGIKKDEGEALKWLMLAADQGHEEATLILKVVSSLQLQKKSSKKI